MKKQKVLLRVREFAPAEKRFDDTSILLLTPVKEDWLEDEIKVKEGEDLHDKLHELLDKKLNELIQNRRDVFIEIEASMPGLTVKVGGGDYTGRIIALSPRPSKLLRIGIIEENQTQSDINQSEEGISSNVSQAFKLPIDKAKWYDVNEDLYLFEGFILSKKQWRAIVFVTEHGERVLLPGDFEAKTIVLDIDEKKSSKAKRQTKARKKKRKTKKKHRKKKKKG